MEKKIAVGVVVGLVVLFGLLFFVATTILKPRISANALINCQSGSYAVSDDYREEMRYKGYDVEWVRLVSAGDYCEMIIKARDIDNNKVERYVYKAYKGCMQGCQRYFNNNEERLRECAVVVLV
jgi:hypothetical protein